MTGDLGESWAHGVATEQLIDLQEWMEARAKPCSIPYPCAFTARLWTFLESIPFGEVGRTSFAERLESLRRCAARAVEEALAARSSSLEPACVTLQFTSRLRSRSDDAARQPFALVLQFADERRFVAVVGLGCEAVDIAELLQGAGRPVSPAGGRHSAASATLVGVAEGRPASPRIAAATKRGT